MSYFAQYSVRKTMNLLQHQRKQGESNETPKAICCCPRVDRRAWTDAAGIGTGHHAIHHHDDDADSAPRPNGEHHDHDDSGNSAANPHHSDAREHHEVQAPSQEGKEAEADNDYNHNSIPAGAY